MTTRVNNITQIDNKALSNAFVLGQLTADYDDGTTITSIAVTATQTALKDGDKFIISGQVFTVAADAAAASTSITVDSVEVSIPIQVGDTIEINKDNLFQQYQRKTEGTIAGMPVTADTLGPITYSGGVYSITGSDSTYVKILPRDFMVNDDATPADATPAVFGDGTNTGVSVEDTSQELIATVNIPAGTTATEVYVWASNATKDVYVYEMDIDANGKGSSIGNGRTDGGVIDITDTAATATNFLMISVAVSNVNHRVWGGKVILTQN